MPPSNSRSRLCRVDQAARNGVCRLTNLGRGFSRWSTYRFKLVISHHPTRAAPVAKYRMSNSAIKDIQRALNAIRSELDNVNQQTRLQVLQLMLGQSQSIIGVARKLDGQTSAKTTPAKTHPKLPRPASPRRSGSQTQPIKRADNSSSQVSDQPIKPLEPLAPKRPR